MYVLVLLQGSQKIPNMPAIVRAEGALQSRRPPAWFLHRCVHLMILVEAPEEKFPLLWTVKFFFFLFYLLCASA